MYQLQFLFLFLPAPGEEIWSTWLLVVSPVTPLLNANIYTLEYCIVHYRRHQGDKWTWGGHPGREAAHAPKREAVHAPERGEAHTLEREAVHAPEREAACSRKWKRHSPRKGKGANGNRQVPDMGGSQ